MTTYENAVKFIGYMNSTYGMYFLRQEKGEYLSFLCEYHSEQGKPFYLELVLGREKINVTIYDHVKRVIYSEYVTGNPTRNHKLMAFIQKTFKSD